jgi:hypothetical protein
MWRIVARPAAGQLSVWCFTPMSACRKARDELPQVRNDGIA